MAGRKVNLVAVDMTNGQQVRLDDGDELRYRHPVPLSAVADILSQPDAWIDYVTESRFEHENEWEGPEEWKPATGRIYSRHAVHVLVVYED